METIEFSIFRALYSRALADLKEEGFRPATSTETLKCLHFLASKVPGKHDGKFMIIPTTDEDEERLELYGFAQVFMLKGNNISSTLGGEAIPVTEDKEVVMVIGIPK